MGGAGEVGGWVEGSAAVEWQKAKEYSTEWPWRRSAAMQRPKRKQINRKAKQNGTCTLGHRHTHTKNGGRIFGAVRKLRVKTVSSEFLSLVAVIGEKI